MEKDEIDEMDAIQGFLDAETVVSRDPLDFRDENKNRVDDRLENKGQV